MFKLDKSGFDEDRKNSQAVEIEELREKMASEKFDADMKLVWSKSDEQRIIDEKSESFKEFQKAKAAEEKLFDSNPKYKIEYKSLLDDYESQMNSQADQKKIFVKEKQERWSEERDAKVKKDKETLNNQIKIFKDEWGAKNQYRLKKKQKERADLEKTVGFLRKLTGGLK